MAINDTNSNPDILPNTTIKILHFTDTTSKNRVMPGGFVISMAQTIYNEYPDVVAVYGGYSSTNAVYEAEMFSTYQIPYAGSTQASPVLSDKNKFPYFVRSYAGT
ncbi:hypothetical protein BCR33DRAFT_743804 [Rhizoclosmatium globosum]|uniref:Receptor ligand binding region domain-containing protein n=1 Tax=Rhizoclosmatium globosum TaxID=329046 RepID=A0A1Y2BHL3_9FUNG|nr:hypothetical protein BCR33DRAFT_743804 [Rhizoclosmatium globosum]|eukprot:ORY33615.1 hypothetical protein BCR33DRAFT_743804 [Rhizoclosmatium globosum]